MVPRLITIPMSHYCEKARWGLDRLGIEYVEDRHIQILHYPAAYRAARTPYVPILVEGRVATADSTAILVHLDRRAPRELRLYPDDPALRARVDQLEHLFDEELGVHTRRRVYFEYLDQPEQMLATAAYKVPRWERAAVKLLFPLARAVYVRRLGVTADQVERGMATVRRIFADVGAMLADGRRFLVGDRFTAADLTFACMAAPLLLPPEYGVPLPAPDQVVATLRADVAELRATPAGAFALRMFATERLRPHTA